MHLSSFPWTYGRSAESAPPRPHPPADARIDLPSPVDAPPPTRPSARLMAEAAHDLNNLLTVIGGFAELALVSATPEGAGLVRDILSACGRAEAVVRAMLREGRRAAGASTPVKEAVEEEVDLGELVRGCEARLACVVGRGVSLRVDAAGSGPLVRADPARMEQVLFNLAGNARDAMPGGGELRLSVSREGAGRGRWAVLRVEDDGVGMGEDVRRRVFDPFFTTKGEGRGTGLGLAMVRDTAERAGGRVGLCSVPGRGTTVEVFLPEAG
jgi:signal transduction histidine kinase